MICPPNYVIPFLIELMASFIYYTVIISIGTPIIVGITLIALIFFAHLITGVYFNPATTFMIYLDGRINSTQLALFIAAQLLAAILAYLFYVNYLRAIVKRKRDQLILI